jgi:prepilin-type N-terminal cleavage/methylation domain-containing protein
MFSLKRDFRAFTLAEVLITLGIIGVVAAMTIPALMTKIQEHVTIRKVKKFHSAINQSLRLALEEEGEVTNWGLPQSGNARVGAFVDTLSKYYKIGTNVGAGKVQKTYTHTYKYLGNNTKWSTYKSNADYHVFTLLDGGLVFIKMLSADCNYNNNQADMNGDVCGLIFYDTNAEKLPNTFGRDIFVFLIKNDIIVPRSKDLGCSKYSGQGEGCSYHIIYEGTMSYLH